MLSTETIESLRFHLGFGNVDASAYPHTPDGFQAIFEQVISPNLSTSAETQAAFAIAAGPSAVTPDSMADIVTGARLVIDVGDDAEIVTVRSTTMTTFAARFAKAHPIDTKIALLSGKQRLLMLLHRADQALEAMQDPSVGATAGLSSVDKGDVSWQPKFQVLKDRQSHYRAIVAEISSLVRVTPIDSRAGAQQLSVY